MKEVLVLEYTKVNDNYYVAQIVFQDESIFKREKFRYVTKQFNVVKSGAYPSFFADSGGVYHLCLKGFSKFQDDVFLTIKAEDLSIIEDMVREVNETFSYARWRSKIKGTYYTVVIENNKYVVVSREEDNQYKDYIAYTTGMYFKTYKEAENYIKVLSSQLKLN